MRLLLLIVFVLWLSPSLQEKDFSRLRDKMVKEQIVRRGISDPSTLSSLRKVQRHLFVPDDLIDYSYDDRPLPIGFGQTISQPYIVAYMTEIIKPRPDYIVLEIGTGSGYQAAVLSGIVKEVYSIEIIDSLGNQAKNRLDK